MPDQHDVVHKGGTMRLGRYPCRLKEDSKCRALYGDSTIFERHRHRFEVNNDYREQLQKAGISFAGVSPDNRLVEMIEMPEHPFFIGCQFHPELKSRPDNPHPLFVGLVEAAIKRKDQDPAPISESKTRRSSGITLSI
jgi:CTP synthase